MYGADKIIKLEHRRWDPRGINPHNPSKDGAVARASARSLRPWAMERLHAILVSHRTPLCVEEAAYGLPHFITSKDQRKMESAPALLELCAEVRTCSLLVNQVTIQRKTVQF